MSVDPRCPVADVPRVLRLAEAAGAWGPAVRAALFHDLDRLEARVDALQAAGPPDALHAIAIKANPPSRPPAGRRSRSRWPPAAYYRSILYISSPPLIR